MIERLLANARVVGALGMRSIKQTFRRPQLMAPILIFPTALLAIQVGGAGSAVNLPTFPDVPFLDFMLAGAMIQACLLAGNSGAIALAVDIEMGFTDRLMAAPISRFAMVLGRLAGTAAMGAFTAIWFMAIGLIFGAHIVDGISGALLVIVLVSATATAIGGIGAAIALRTGSASVVQGLFPLVFVVLFLSTAFFPENLLLEPARAVSAWNPFSFIVEAVRNEVAFGFSTATLLEGVAAIAAIAAIGLVLSARALRYRLMVG